MSHHQHWNIVCSIANWEGDLLRILLLYHLYNFGLLLGRYSTAKAYITLRGQI
jgi:hypothetical protein